MAKIIIDDSGERRVIAVSGGSITKSDAENIVERWGLDASDIVNVK